MKLVLNLDGEEYLPLRGALVLSHEYLNLGLLAEYLYENAFDADGEARRLDAFDPLREMEHVSPHAFRALAMRARALRQASVHEQTKALPAGLLIRLDQFRSHVVDRMTIEAMEMSGSSHIVLPNLELPSIAEQDLGVLLEGLGHLYSPPPDAPRLSDLDPELQKRAEELAAQWKQKIGSWPTRTLIAEQLAAHDHRDPQTIERRIRATWKSRKRNAKSGEIRRDQA